MKPHAEEAHGGNDEDDDDDGDDDDGETYFIGNVLSNAPRDTEARCHALASSGYPGSQLLQAAAAG